MDAVLEGAKATLSNYWQLATQPLHRLTWQTFSLLALIVLVSLALAGLLLRYSWRFRKPTIFGAEIKKEAHRYESHFRISAADYRALHRLGDKFQLGDDAGSDFLNRHASRYYLITLVETGKRKPVLYREMRLHVPLKKGRCQPREVQLDASSLTHVRIHNGYEEDDDANSAVAGTYDVYIRQIRFYDIRHWLMHPNREIRTVVWVTLITTTLPTLIEVLFG